MRKTVERLGERDGWSCRLCGGDVDRGLYWPNVNAGSVDHVLPVKLGGTDDGANLQLAHLGCNIRKGATLV